MLQPEFFLDRSLGKQVAERLRANGWIVHRIADYFPDDAQDVSDPDWIEYGVEREWTPLCKDGRIRGIEAERRPLVDHAAVLFYLDNQQLRVEEMVQRFLRAEGAICRAVERGGPAIYAVGPETVRRTWP